MLLMRDDLAMFDVTIITWQLSQAYIYEWVNLRIERQKVDWTIYLCYEQYREV